MAPHADLLHAETFAKCLHDRRRTRGIGLRAAAEEAGVSFNTFSRVEKGHIPDIETFSRLARWLGRAPAEFLGPGRVTSDSTPDVIEAQLRGDPALSADAAGRIAGIVRELYAQLAHPQDVAMACHLRAAPTFTPEASALFAELIQEMRDALIPRP